MADRNPDTPEPAVDELKRKARRRLVGAVVLALAAAVLLPMLLEKDPKPLGEDVSVKIPPIDDGRFVSKLSGKEASPATTAAKSAPAAGAPSGKAETPAIAPAKTEALANVPPAAKVEAPVAAPAAAPAKAEPPASAAIKSAPSAPPPAPKRSVAEAEQRMLSPNGKAATPAPAAKTATPAKAETPPAAAPAATPAATPEPPPVVAAATPAPPPKAETPASAAVTPPPAKAAPPAASPVPVATPAPAPAAAASTPQGYVVQLAAFADDKGANALAGKLKKSGYAAYVEPLQTSRGTLWRVRIGGFGSRPEADAARDKLKGEGQNGIVVPAK
jgi:DedD protein